VNPEQRDVAELRVRAERLYRYVAEGLTYGQLMHYPRGSTATARSTVSGQVTNLAEQLGVDLIIHKRARR
jgi:hypothetical protein